MNMFLRLAIGAIIVVAIDELSSWCLNNIAKKLVDEAFDEQMKTVKSTFTEVRPTYEAVAAMFTYVNRKADRDLRSHVHRGEYRTRSLAAIQAYIDNWTPTA